MGEGWLVEEWGGGMFLFLQKRDDIQAVRGRGLAMFRKSEGNVDWKPQEENAEQGAESFSCFYGGVEKAGERPPFHSPAQFQLTSHNRNTTPFTYPMNKPNSYQCTNSILRVTRPDGHWLEISHARQPHPSPDQY